MALICILSLVIFSVLGIFSAYYRNLAKEAFICVFSGFKGKRCETELDKRIKAKIVAKIYRISPGFAKYISQRFVLLSYVFVIILILTVGFFANSIYLYIVYGNCNGENSNAYCVINDVLGNDESVDINITLTNPNDCKSGQNNFNRVFSGS